MSARSSKMQKYKSLENETSFFQIKKLINFKDHDIAKNSFLAEVAYNLT